MDRIGAVSNVFEPVSRGLFKQLFKKRKFSNPKYCSCFEMYYYDVYCHFIRINTALNRLRIRKIIFLSPEITFSTGFDIKKKNIKMIRILIPLALLLVTVTANAQIPSHAKSIDLSAYPESFACPPGQQNFAGTFSLGTFIGQSNDTDLDTLYLCFGDSIFIDHNGDQVLTGDPDPATEAGVGYAFYDCPPSAAFSGPELSVITSDPCLALNPAPPIGQLWISTAGDPSGDQWFFNQGIIQTTFNTGDPTLLWFAPITYDALAGNNYIFEGNPEGPCVNVNTDEAFAVVYLNEVEATNITNMNNGNSCRGAFDIAGGLPEFDNSEVYDISITLNSDPSITGVVTTGGASHNSNVEFKIFEPGLYDITITDGKGCGTSFQLDMAACPALSLNLDELGGEVGEIVCVGLTAADFIDIQSFQFSLNWDVSVALFDGITNFNPDLINGGISPVGTGPVDPNSMGLLTFSWFDNTFLGTDLPDGTVLFEICFELIGPVGSSTGLDFANAPTPIEITNTSAQELGLVINNGSMTVIDPDALIVDIDIDSISCGETPPLEDGSFTVTVEGGVPPYSYLWQEDGGAVQGPVIIPMSGGSSTQDNLPGGIYFITITDDAFAEHIDAMVVFEPLSLGVGPNVTNPTCNGDSTGAFSIFVNGGTAPYSFDWSNGDTVQNLTNIPAGFYEVVVTDDNGCTASASGTLFNPPPITTNVNSTNASCSGIADGLASAMAMGGAGGFSYEWNTTPPQLTATANNLEIGQYVVSVTDTDGCVATDTANIGAATIIQANAIVENITCFGANDGSITTNPTAIGIDNGGYTFDWSPVVAGNNDNSAVDLGPDTITVTITDALGCNIDSTYIIEEPDSITINVTNLVQESCTVGGDGEITVEASGGTVNPGSDYQYVWSNMETGPEITDLSADTYTVTVTDDNGCIDSLPITLTPPQGPIIDSFQVVDVLCSSSTNGQITVFFSDGNAPVVDVEWSNNQSGPVATNLTPGDYTVTLTDQDGCITTGTATVGAPAPLSLADTLLENPTCFEDCDGTIGITMAGGTTPYTFEWSHDNMLNQPLAFDLCAGTYTVTVTDANNCPSEEFTFILEDPAPITVDFSNIIPTSCFEGVPCDGSATAVASGGGAGTGNYTFNWESGTIEMGMSSTAGDLCSGFQTVVVSDALGCNTTDSVNIPSPPQIELDFIASVFEDASCNGDADGSASVVATGGTPGYTYFWPGSGIDGPDNDGLVAGDYDVVITDANNCVVIETITINEPDVLEANVRLDSTRDVTCPEGTDGQIFIEPVGGNPGVIDYDWSGNVANAQRADNLPAGLYSVTITDSEGCTAETQWVVNEPPPIQVVIPPIPEPNCFGEKTTLVIDTAFGGNGAPFEYIVDNLGRDDISFAEDITAGEEHDVTIFDANNCTFDTTIFVDQPAPVQVAIDQGTEIEIELGESLVLEAFPSLVLPIDSVIWTPAGTFQCLDSFPSTDCLEILTEPTDDITYTITIIDINGCIGEAEIFVDVDNNRNVYIPNIFSPNGDGTNDLFSVYVGNGVTNVNFFQVYDRWGEILYDVSNFLPGDNNRIGWDGSFRGKEMNPGVYIYLAEVVFDDGEVLLYRGSITLVR